MIGVSSVDRIAPEECPEVSNAEGTLPVDKGDKDGNRLEDGHEDKTRMRGNHGSRTLPKNDYGGKMLLKQDITGTRSWRQNSMDNDPVTL